MYSFTLATEIGAAPARVWRALCDPKEVVAWDAGVCEAIDAPPDYPRAGQHVRWRLRGDGGVLHDRPREVIPQARLRAALCVGRTQIDETYTLAPTPAGSRLQADLVVRVELPLLGGLLARWRAGPQLRATVASSMAALKRHCELHR